MVDIIEQLKERFPQAEASLTTVKDLGNIPVFLIGIKNEKYLAENWKKMSNMIASLFQTTLSADQEFERWNTYTFFICSGPVTRFLRGRIENNKFSSRKIVVQNSAGDVDLLGLISKYITGEMYLKDFTQDVPRKLSRNGDLEKSAKSNDPSVNLKAVIGDRFVLDRRKRRDAEFLRDLLDELEGKGDDETI